MNISKMNKARFGLAVMASLMLLPTAYATGDEGHRIMSEVDNRYRGDAWDMTVYMLLVDENDRERERTLRMQGKMDGDDEKTVTYVLDPPRLRGTGILTYNWDDADRLNESWLYLPDLGRVTRLTTSNRSDYFLGSDFTYGDLEGLEVDDFEYEIDRDASTEDETVIVATPNNREIVDKYGYTQVQYWVDTDRHVFTRAQYWLKNEGWVKYYSQFDFENIDGVWLPGREQMILTRNNQRVNTTVISRGEVEINPDLHDDIFTTNGLQRAAE